MNFQIEEDWKIGEEFRRHEIMHNRMQAQRSLRYQMSPEPEPRMGRDYLILHKLTPAGFRIVGSDCLTVSCTTFAYGYA